MNNHRGREARIVRLLPRYSVLNNKSFPFRKDIGSVGNKDEESLHTGEFCLCFGDAESQAILSCWPGGDCPKLDEVLGKDG